MIISFKNQQAFNELYLHDSIFLNFNFDYEHRMIKISYKNHEEQKLYELTFRQVVAFQAQTCCFWGPSSRIYHAWIDEDPVYFESLLRIQAENAEKYSSSNLDRGLSYISIVLQLISGDDIRITCESIQIERSVTGDGVVGQGTVL